MKLRRWMPALALLLAACGGGQQPAPEHAGAAPPLTTVEVVASDASGRRIWDGTVEAVDAAVLTAQTNARVLALPHDVGDTVRKGDVLVQLTDVEQQSAESAARAQMAEARAAYVEAEANYQRYAAIYPQGYVSKAAYDQALAQRNAAKARLDAATQQWRGAGVQQDYTTVRAPYDGVITHRYVKVGEPVAGPPFPQQLIAVASLAHLRIEASLPQAVAESLRGAGHAEVLVDGGKRHITSDRLTVFPVADPATHTVKVRVDLPAGTDGLYPGMTVKLAFGGKDLAVDGAELSVPASALVRRGELAGVYVVNGAAVSLRQVRVGNAQGGRVVILAGLAAGEKVATDPEAARRWLVERHAKDAP